MQRPVGRKSDRPFSSLGCARIYLLITPRASFGILRAAYTDRVQKERLSRGGCAIFAGKPSLAAKVAKPVRAVLEGGRRFGRRSRQGRIDRVWRCAAEVRSAK